MGRGFSDFAESKAGGRAMWGVGAAGGAAPPPGALPPPGRVLCIMKASEERSGVAADPAPWPVELTRRSRSPE